MKALVTGGTGFVGQEILRQLHSAGHEAHLLARAPKSGRAQAVAKKFAGQVRAGNVLDADSLKSSCAGMDAVIHLVGIISEVGAQTFESVHTRGTENILAAVKNSGVRRFVHMSALGTRADAVSRYHKSKWDAEELVRGSGLDWTIFRPSIIYGEGDGFVNLFAKIARWSPVVPVMGNGGSKFQPVAVENVAAAFVKSLTEPRAIGRTFDLCGDETLSLNRIVDEILFVTERRRWKFHVPMGVAKIQARLLEIIFADILHRAPPLNRDQLLMLAEDNVGGGEVADQLFGLKKTTFRGGISRFLSGGSA